MRLLNTSTLEVQEFLESQVPEYVILSHTWRDEEVTLQDLLSGIAPAKKGYAKLTGCCKRAKDDGFAYCWIDTCCIDKTSSTELSEAINSMYQWYKNACVCYAYLEDVCSERKPDDFIFKPFAKSKWFTRGWTLQELIAPPIVEFYDNFWSEIGTRSSLQYRLMSITGINTDVLTGGNPLKYAVAVRLSWAAGRQTSRLEDQAYCLLGILGVNMPLLYGEGKRAFLRLQEEMLRVDEDYTLFAWDALSPSVDRSFATESLLANSPSDFRTFLPVRDLVYAELSKKDEVFRRDDLSKTCFSVLPPPEDHSPPRLTSRGCHLSLPLFAHEERSWYGCLSCLKRGSSGTFLLCIMLRQDEGNEYRFERDWDTSGEQGTLICLPLSAAKEFRYTSIYVITSIASSSRVQDEGLSMVRIALEPTLNSKIALVSSRNGDVQIPSNLLDSGSDRERTRSEASDTARQMPDEGPHTADMKAPLPDLMSTTCYSGRENDDFEFYFELHTGLEFKVIVTVRVDHNPYVSAYMIHKTGYPDAGPTQLPRLPELPGPPRQRRPLLLPPSPPMEPVSGLSLDRTSLFIRDATDSFDFGWSIRLSIRRAGSTPLAPNTKQYVLTLKKEQSRT